MPPAPLSPPPRKQAILQAVYEANVGAPTSAPRPPVAPRERRRRRRSSAALAVLLAALVPAAGWGLVWSAQPAPAVAGPAPMAPSAAPEAAASRHRAALGDGAGVADLMDLQVRTIVIDPGHGGRDPGAAGPNRLEEKEVTLDVARRLRDRLAAHDGLEILLTREDDRAISLRERVAFANGRGADLFVSVHVNALPDPSLAPVETFYFDVEADTIARQLAHAENGGSTFSLSEFNAALRRAGTAVKLQESRALAEAVQRAMLEERAVRQRRPAADWGARPAPFGVLLHTEAPAVLAEITALSNPAEEAHLRTDAYREAIAAALERGVLAYLRRPPTPHGDHADARAQRPEEVR